MKTTHIAVAASCAFILAAVLPVYAASDAADKDKDKDKEQITKVENAIAAAKTADELLKYYTDDAVLYDAIAEEVIGKKAISDDVAPQLSGMPAGAKVTILKLNVITDGKLGFANSTQKYEAPASNGKPGATMVFRQTDCLRKTSGKWLIAVQHVSVPYDPKTGMAVFTPPEQK